MLTGRLWPVEVIRSRARPPMDARYDFRCGNAAGGCKEDRKILSLGVQNGMGEDELEVLTSEEIRNLEPHVRGHGAIWSKTDTSVDYRAFTKSLRTDAEGEGIKFLTGIEVGSVKVAGDLLEIKPTRNATEPVRARFLINCAGGSSLRIAHMLGLGTQYFDLNFRGEYWEIGKEWTYLATRNIYTVAQHPELPFLDPHWIVRADGRREIGPNAVPVAGPYTYRGFFRNPTDALEKILEPTMANKVALLLNK